MWIVGQYISLTHSPWTTMMDYQNGLLERLLKWTNHMDSLKKEKFSKKIVCFETICRCIMLQRIITKLSMLSPMVRGG